MTRRSTIRCSVKSGPGLSAAYRDLLGWMPAASRMDFRTGSLGSMIKLAAVDGGPAGTRLVRIFLGLSSRYITVELRVARGWDRGIDRSGVLVRRMESNGSYYLLRGRSGSTTCKPGTPTSTPTRTSP